MAAKSSSRTMPEPYFDLVRRFPLTHIRDDGHLSAKGGARLRDQGALE